MVLASFAGAAASATAATHATPHRHPVSAGRVRPDIPTTPDGVTVSVGTPVDITDATAQAGTAVTVPTLTITDPGVVATTTVITLQLVYAPSGFGLTATVPTVTPTGAGVTVSPATVNTGTGTIRFTVTKTIPGTAATYAVSGAAVSGNSTTTAGGFGMVVGIGTTMNPFADATISPGPLGAVTSILPAAYGATAPDTAAVLFRAEADSAAHAVILASDSEPQDAESANYLAAVLSNNGPDRHTGILLTDPTTLSPAVSGVLRDYSSVDTIYIVGGTSVVSAAIQTQLEAENYAVVRLAGPDQYSTNDIVDNYVAQNFTRPNQDIALDYSDTARYNDTAGSESATTTRVGSVKTAIVVSGASASYQDGVVSGPLSYNNYLPVIQTAPTDLSASALSQLTAGGYQQVIVLGGPAAVSDSVVDQLTASTEDGGAGVVVFRIAGRDASDTSTMLARFMVAANEINEFSTTDDGGGGVLIARGNGFQDALAAGSYAGDTGYTPILLTENATTLGAPLTAYLRELGLEDGIFAVQAIGGPLSVTPAVQQAASDAQFSALSSD